ncbi:sorting nexin-11 [Embiotoca jacksoni]|uniref:sorting nexin-11 n=1 Tax=Embiotoca jacksoni TaxID=100190 RepID=UPI0037047AAE
MIRNQEEDEFVAVRVQDPRVQNEGSWNSFVDYKIFLHTNSKAFTAKTSCVRRRYSEFSWLRKKLQKNAGLVPVPNLPAKSFFSFSSEDFLERRRKGLQAFLDKVVHTTVCLSDSQLHLFLQTQLPLGHIQDCVQGHTPYSVTDAILTYASSNRGLAQAQEDDSNGEPSLTVSYESMESPAPHQPCPQTTDPFSPELFSCGDPLEDLLEIREQNSAEIPLKEKSSIKISQKNNQLEAVFEDCGPAEATFYLGGSPDDRLSPAEQSQQRSCQIQTPVVVHSPMGTDFEDDGAFEDTEVKTVAHPDAQENKHTENVRCEPEKCENLVAILDFKDCEEQIIERNGTSREEEVLEDVGSEKAPENLVFSEAEEVDVNSDGQMEPDNDRGDESGSERRENGVPDVETGGDDSVQEKEAKQEVGFSDGTRDESDEDSHSLPSSNGSIVKVSDEEPEDSSPAANGFVGTSPKDVSCWSGVEACSRNILDLQMNGGPEDEEDIPAREDEDLQYIGGLSKSPDVNSAAADGDLTENSDISILETGSADSKCAEQEALSSLSLDAPEDAQEVEAH